MSVVNQMLRDLDRREAGEQPLYTQHIAAPTASPRKALMLITLAFTLALATSYGALRYLNESPAMHDSPDAAVDVMQHVSAEAPPAPKASEDETSDDAALNEPPVTEPVTLAVSQETPAPPVSEAAQPENVTSAVAAMTAPAPIAVPVVSPAPPAAVPTPEIKGATIEAPHEVLPVHIDVRPYRPTPTADGEFRRGAALINQGRSQEARAALQAALALEPGHEAARQTLAVLLIENGVNNEAEALLAEGLRLNPAQTNFAIVLARLQLERGDAAGALQVLRAHASAAESNAEYRAFAAALLQRLGRHAEAIEEYRAVLTLAPHAGIWWVGLGRSYEATGETSAAAEAYARARDTGSLNAGIAQFVEQKLQTLH